LIANLSYFILLIALACAIYAAALALLSVWRQRPDWLASAHRAALLTWPLVSLAMGGLIYLIATNHFELDYVASVSNRAMPLYLKVTAVWGGQAGSLLFWGWLMASFSGAAMLRKWERDQALMPYVVFVTMVTLAFFLGLVATYENPFARLWQTTSGETLTRLLQPAGTLAFIPADGRGLSPLLRHPGMVFHPPMLYIGFVSFVVPYAFAMAALAARQTDDAWIRTTRRWTLVGWLFLSLGLILGGRWAYDVLGWGGYWAWDPVENAAFMPWLTGTAFLHSVMLQEKRGMLKKWNMSLIILTYALVIFGTFLTRSGVLSSVHAFAQSAIGPAFFVFILLTFVGSLLLLFREWDNLKSDNQFDGLLSRDASFLLNNFLFMGITVIVFLGTVYPMVSELVTNTKISVGPPFYNQTTGPVFAALVLLMGVCPLLAWRRTSARRLGRVAAVPLIITVVFLIVLVVVGIRSWGALLGLGISLFVAITTVIDFGQGILARFRMAASGQQRESVWQAIGTLIDRNRHRYGGYTIHLGVVLMAIGIIGTNFFQQQTQGQLKQGEQLVLGQYMVTYKTLTDQMVDADKEVTSATLAVYKNGQYVGDLHPSREFYLSSGEPVTIPGVRNSVEDDLYIILASWEQISAGSATFKIYLNPLINWLWAGGLVFILGTLVAAWPSRDEN
jgi:cytochrome c-type biogenesis protein CcmF